MAVLMFVHVLVSVLVAVLVHVFVPQVRHGGLLDRQARTS